MERFGVQGTQFVLQIILARILEPKLYGVLSIMIIFTTIANVFVQSGFNTALIQNKDVSEDDYSSVLWVSLFVATILYGFIYIFAPYISIFYEMPEIVIPLRVLALMLFPGALNSVQLAKNYREMNFKKVFYSNLGGVISSGIVSVIIAYMGGGLWALVIQSLLNMLVTCVVMFFTTRIKFRFICDLDRIKVLFSYGWKLLVSTLLDTLYQELRSLVIGKKYDSGTLGYYNRGKQFPQFLISAVNGTVQSVMLPAMSSEQDNAKRVKELMRNSIMFSSYIIFPLMAGLASIAETLVRIILTDKWLPCVPYMQIYCAALAFYPVHSCNLQAINAMGRSDIFLKLEIIKKVIGISSLLIAIFCFNSPMAIAMTGVFTALVNFFVNAYPNKKLIEYSYGEQIRDFVPSLIISSVMCLCVWFVGKVNFVLVITLIIQIFTGIFVYLFLSKIFRLKPYKILLKEIKKFKKKNI